MNTTTTPKPVAFKFAETPTDTFVSGADLTNADESTRNAAIAALEAAVNEATAGVPESNVLNDWPVDADGDLTPTPGIDLHIIARDKGTYVDHNVIHLVAMPSLAAIMESPKGSEFAESVLISALKRRAGAIMGSYLKSGEYALPGKLSEWLTGRETGASDNAARGNAKLFNAIAADLAEALRKGVKGARIAKADMRGLLASRAAMLDKFNLHDNPQAEATLAEKLFAAAERAMIAHANAANAAWAEAPAVNDKGEPKAEAAPYPVNPESGQADRASLAHFFKPLDQWKSERDEATEEAASVDLDAISFDM